MMTGVNRLRRLTAALRFLSCSVTLVAVGDHDFAVT